MNVTFSTLFLFKGLCNIAHMEIVQQFSDALAIAAIFAGIGMTVMVLAVVLPQIVAGLFD